MYSNKELGEYGEGKACEYLQNKGYKIIERNFRCHVGEADIIATKDNGVIFVEVKTRSQERYGEPSEAVNCIKKKHIYKVAEWYSLKNNLWDLPISLDVIEVYVNEKIYRINHIKNAIFERPAYRG